ncbi:MAG: hypothetical protein LW698_06705 [Planctomycetaceae bacterium]|jgi:hypothetical protein|nr:hypothetical protein [Planctomycetaceae bacterium]
MHDDHHQDQTSTRGLPCRRSSERETIIAAARHVVHLDPATRAAAFVGLSRTLETVLGPLSAPERRRRRLAAERLDPLPSPWWKYMRRTEWPTADAAS